MRHVPQRLPYISQTFAPSDYHLSRSMQNSLNDENEDTSKASLHGKMRGSRNEIPWSYSRDCRRSTKGSSTHVLNKDKYAWVHRYCFSPIIIIIIIKKLLLCSLPASYMCDASISHDQQKLCITAIIFLSMSTRIN